jgi:hypothetical protein
LVNGVVVLGDAAVVGGSFVKGVGVFFVGEAALATTATAASASEGVDVLGRTNLA